MSKLRRLLMSSTALLSVSPAFADGPTLPNGGQFVAGSGAIGRSGAAMTIDQSTGRGVINWQGFSIGQGGSVQVNNGSGATLNRVVGSDISSIQGSLKATGSLYLVNPQGVVIGPSGVVTTGGDFVASTHDIPTPAFMSGGSLLFKSESQGTITNLGQVSSTGGDVVLIAREVTNGGTLSAPKGTVGLAGGTEVLLAEAGANGGERVFVRAGTGRVDNQGVIEAAQAELKAAGGNMYALAGNNGGVVRATGTETRQGRIWLTAESGDVGNSGTLAARNADGAGGRVDVAAPAGTVWHSGTIDVRGTGAGKAGGTAVVAGDRIALQDGSSIDASGRGDGGKVLIGGDWQGGRDSAKKLVADTVPTARRVVMTAGASIKADGGSGSGGGTGKGGSVVLWSEELTRFAGSISATAGLLGGDGGQVETSSAGILQATGSVAAGAAAGQAGKWLLDPSDVTVTASGQDGFTSTGATDLFDAGSSTHGTITAATILAGLNSVDVTIQSLTGNITVDDTIAYTGGRNALLTFVATGNLVFNKGVSYSGANTLDLSLQVNGTVTQGAGADAALTVRGLLLGDITSGGAGTKHPVVTLDNTSNAIRTIAGWPNTLVLKTTSDLTVGTVQGTSGLKVTENLFLTVNSANGLLTIDQAMTRTSSASTFALTADRMAVNAQVDQGQTNATVAKITTYSAGRSIILGGTDADEGTAANALEISAAEYALLGKVTGNQGWSGRTMQYGDGSTGPISITAAMVNNGTDQDQYLDPPTNSQTNSGYGSTVRSSVTLVSGSSITESGAGSIEALYLELQSNGVITLNGQNQVTYLRNVYSQNHDVAFTALVDGAPQSGGRPGAGLALANGGTINAGTGNFSLTVVTPSTNQSIVQLFGALTADGLELVGAYTTFYFYNPDISVNKLAASVNQLSFYNTKDLVISTVGGTSGITQTVYPRRPLRSVAVEANGTITQDSTAPIQVANFDFGRGTYILNNPNNHADYLGTYSYYNESTIEDRHGQPMAVSGGISWTDSGTIKITTDVNQNPLDSPNTVPWPLVSGGSISLTARNIIVLPDAYNESNNGAGEVYGIVAAGSVTLNAIESITVNAPIYSGAGTVLQNYYQTVGAMSNDDYPTPAYPTVGAGPFSGNITLTSNTGGTGGTISVYSAGLYSNGGTITLSGGADPTTGYALGDTSTDGILLQGSVVDAAGGNITMRGKGKNGISLTNASQIVTTTGSITLTGVGMGVTALAQTNDPDAASAGIQLSADPTSHVSSLIQTTTGAITLTGTGALTATTNRNFGISFWGGDVKSSGGAISLTGNGGGTTNSLANDGIRIDAPTNVSNTILSQGANAGTITLTGHGRGGNSDGIRMWNYSTIQSAKGKITLTGSATPLQVASGQHDQFDSSTDTVLTANDPASPVANVQGVEINYTSTVKNTGGAIDIDGSAKFTPDTPAADGEWTGNYNLGVHVDGSALVQATEAITITGKGGGWGTNNWDTCVGNCASADGTSSYNDGVRIYGAAHIVTAGPITITGTAGDGSNPMARDAQQGVTIQGTSVVETTATGGTITITGNRGDGSTAAAYYHGIQLNGSGAVRTADADIVMTGHGSGQFSSGFILRGTSSVTAGGSGNITIVGTDFAGTAALDGSWHDQGNSYYVSPTDTIAVRLSGGTISAHNGNISITGTNTSDDTNSPNSIAADIGINMLSAATIQTDGTGSITLTGTGGGNRNSFGGYGVHLTGGTVQATGTGSVTVDGTAGPTGNYAAAQAIGNNPYVDWNGYSNAGLYVGSASVTTAAGALTLKGTNQYAVTLDLTDPMFTDEIGNFAVYTDTGANIRAAGGALTITGLGANGSVVLNTPATAGPTGISTANQAITVGATTDVRISGAVNAGSGGLTVEAGRSGTGNVTLSGAAQLTVSGGANLVVAAQGGNFINTASAGNSVLALGTGRWLVYSTNRSLNTGEVTGQDWRRYNASYSGLAPADVTYTGNGYIYTIAPSVAVALSGAQNKTYDGTTAATGVGLAVTGHSGEINGDTAATVLTATTAAGTFADRNAGTDKTVNFDPSLVTVTVTDDNGKPVYGYGSTVTGRAAVAAAQVTVSATDATKTYGQTDPSFGYTATGLQTGDSVATVFSGALSRGAGEDVGSYGITLGSLAANTNYTVSYKSGTLAITPATLVIQAQDATRISGIANPTLGVSYSGFQRSDGSSAVSGLEVSTAAGTASPAGSYAIIASGARASNYTIRYVSGTLTVTEAPSTYVPTPALGGSATGGSSSTTGFQSQLAAPSESSALTTFLAPVSAPAPTSSAARPTVSVVPVTGGAGIVTVDTPAGAGGIGGGAGPSSGGQLEAAVNNGAFNVVFSQPVGFRVTANAPGQGGAPAGGGAGLGQGGTGGGALAAGTSFTTFGSGDNPSVTVVAAGSGGAQGQTNGSSSDKERRQ